MCFTPQISLATAIIEFIIVIYLFKRIKDKRLRALPFFVLFLGLYQLTEFFLCTTNNLLWARLGFISYTFLPILLMQFFYDLSKTKLSRFYYVLPSAYAIIALIHPYFIVSATCQSFYIEIKNLFFWDDKAILLTYFFYYGAFPLAGYLKLFGQDKTEKVNWKFKLAIILFPATLVLAQGVLILFMLNQSSSPKEWIITSIALIIISLSMIFLAFLDIRASLFRKILATVIFSSVIVVYVIYIILPGFGISFASIYCQFALLYSIAAILFTEAMNTR